MRALSRMLRLLKEHPQKTLLKSSPLIKYLPNFPSQENPWIKNCKPKNSLEHPCHIKSGVPFGYNYNNNTTVPKGTYCAKLFSDAPPNLVLTIIPLIQMQCHPDNFIFHSFGQLFLCRQLYSLRYRQNLTLVKSIYETVPKSLLWAFNCVPGFKYMSWLAC